MFVRVTFRFLSLSLNLPWLKESLDVILFMTKGDLFLVGISDGLEIDLNGVKFFISIS